MLNTKAHAMYSDRQPVSQSCGVYEKTEKHVIFECDDQRRSKDPWHSGRKIEFPKMRSPLTFGFLSFTQESTVFWLSIWKVAPPARTEIGAPGAVHPSAPPRYATGDDPYFTEDDFLNRLVLDEAVQDPSLVNRTRRTLEN